MQYFEDLIQNYQKPKPVPFTVSPQANRASAFKMNIITMYLQNAGLAAKDGERHKVITNGLKIDKKILVLTCMNFANLPGNLSLCLERYMNNMKP